MHILYIHQHFATPAGSTGTRSYEFARRWVKAGHKVTMITGRYDIGGLKTQKKLFSKIQVEGINVIVVGAGYSNKQSFLRRIISFLSFCLFSIVAGLRSKKVDAVYATSTPLTVGIPALIIKWFKKAPLVFEVRDQWPEIPIEMRVIKNKLLISVLLWLEKTIYNHSSAIVALSPAMAEGIKKVVTKNKPVEVIPNSCDTNTFRPEIDGREIRKKFGWDDKLVLLHFGAIGRANGLEFVIEAAEKLKDHKDIHFVILGDGSEKKTLKEKAKQLGLNNIEILDSVNKEQMPELVAASDISMVIFANYPILEHNSANKFFDSLSAGKPILLNYSGWQREVLEENNAGFGCDLCNIEQFTEKILYFNSSRNELNKLSQNARRIALEEFDRDTLAQQALTLIEKHNTFSISAISSGSTNYT